MDVLFDATAILESIADSFFVLDPAGRFAFVTPKAGELLGRPAAEILGKTFVDAFPEQCDSDLFRWIEKSRVEQSSTRFEHFQPALNRWFEQQTYVNPDGGIAVYGRDVTSRHRLEEALRDSEERFRRLVESNIIGVFVRSGGQITEANDCFLSMIGYTREELVRNQVVWRDITLFDQRALDRSAEDDLLKERFSSAYERDFVRRDGARVPVMIASTRVDPHPDDVDMAAWEVLY